MKKILKQYMMAIVAVMLVVGFSAFKVVEKIHTSSQTDWYEVGPRIGNPSILEVKLIMSSDPTEGEDDENCATENPGTICAIQLEVETSAPSPVGQNINDISTLPGVLEHDRAFSPLD